MSESRPDRQATGVPGLDRLLGGGLIPGTLTVVVGATGAGKTQLGLQFAQAGLVQESRRAALFDLSSRGDSQSHADYARRMFDWPLSAMDCRQRIEPAEVFDAKTPWADYLHVFDYHGRRVTRQEMDFDEWRLWQAEVNAKLQTTIAFLYGHLIRGTRRVVIDGIEPVDRPQDSIQFSLFEYIYQQILRKDPEWVARDLLREHYRAHAELAARHVYEVRRVSCLLLYTSAETMLDDLISRPLDEGDVLSNANTLIYMGKIRDGQRIGRALYIPKHRGSPCSDQITPYRIDEQGMRVEG